MISKSQEETEVCWHLEEWGLEAKVERLGKTEDRRDVHLISISPKSRGTFRLPPSFSVCPQVSPQTAHGARALAQAETQRTTAAATLWRRTQASILAGALLRSFDFAQDFGSGLRRPLIASTSMSGARRSGWRSCATCITIP